MTNLQNLAALKDDMKEKIGPLLALLFRIKRNNMLYWSKDL